MQRTQNYNLCQWAAEDRILRSDFNADNQKIDAALAEMPRIAVGSYVGNGQYGSSHKNTLTFDFAPKLVFIPPWATNRQSAIAWIYGQTNCIVEPDSNAATVKVTWNGNELSWYNTENAMFQLNESGRTYQYIAIG